MFVAEFWKDIRIAIPTVVKGLKDPDSNVRKAAVKGVSRLAEQGIY